MAAAADQLIFTIFGLSRFPLVKFCTSRQYLSLNEIGYGNVEYCGPVVSADVVELGSSENRTYSSEKQTVAHTDTSVQADT